jgi:hypothetical protein
MKASDDVCLSMPEMKSRKAGCPHSAHIRHQKPEKSKKKHDFETKRGRRPCWLISKMRRPLFLADQPGALQRQMQSIDKIL